MGKKTLTRFMIQHHTEFFPVERKKLICVFISACLFVMCLSGVSSFNNSFINKGDNSSLQSIWFIPRVDHVVFMGLKRSTRHIFYQVLLVCCHLSFHKLFILMCHHFISDWCGRHIWAYSTIVRIILHHFRFCKMEGNKTLCSSVESFR